MRAAPRGEAGPSSHLALLHVKKFYRLTTKGRARLSAGAAGWQRLTEAVGLILGLADGGAE